MRFVRSTTPLKPFVKNDAERVLWKRAKVSLGLRGTSSLRVNTFEVEGSECLREVTLDTLGWMPCGGVKEGG